MYSLEAFCLFSYIYIFFRILFTANFKGVEITIMKKSTTKMHYKPQIQIVYSIQRERDTQKKKRKTVGDLNIETPVITRPTKQHRHHTPINRLHTRHL